MQRSSKHTSLVILGAGPAGLTAGYEALKAGIKLVTILERDSQVGGLAKTVVNKGNRFDIGGHRFYSKSEWVNAWWQKMLGSNFQKVKRLSRIYYHKKFFRYPLEPLDALGKLGLGETALILLSYLGARLRPIRPETTFEAWVVNRFGWRLYRRFFKSYTEKVWGISTKELSADWAAQRIREFTLGMALKSALNPRTRNQTTLTKTLITEFHYPRLGPGMMWEATGMAIQKQGGTLYLDTPVAAIRYKKNNHFEVVTTTDDQPFRANWIISTIPLKALVGMLSPTPPPAVARAAEALRYRDFLTVIVVVRRAHLFPDQWIYVHEPAVRVGRIQNFKNWSQQMVKDPRLTCLGLEYFVSQDDELWGMEDRALVELGKRELSAIGLVGDNEVVDGMVVRVAQAYPVYDHGYREHVGIIREWLQRHTPRLLTAGRNGLHHYNNQDHAMLSGKAAAEKILGRTADPWETSDDTGYFEAQT